MSLISQHDSDQALRLPGNTVTARILGFNDQLRLLERQLLIDKKKYPSSVAMRRMKD